MARILKVICNVCYSRAVVRKSERLTSELTNLYCTCLNPDCEHKFLIAQEFSHTIKSSKLTQSALLKMTFSMLPKQEKEEIRKVLFEEENE